MPVSSVKLTKAMKREQAIVHEALIFFFKVFSKSKLRQDRSQMQGRKSQAKIGFAKFSTLFFCFAFFFPNKDRSEFLGQAS